MRGQYLERRNDEARQIVAMERPDIAGGREYSLVGDEGKWRRYVGSLWDYSPPV